MASFSSELPPEGRVLLLSLVLPVLSEPPFCHGLPGILSHGPSDGWLGAGLELSPVLEEPPQGPPVSPGDEGAGNEGVGNGLRQGGTVEESLGLPESDGEDGAGRGVVLHGAPESPPPLPEGFVGTGIGLGLVLHGASGAGTEGVSEPPPQGDGCGANRGIIKDARSILALLAPLNPVGLMDELIDGDSIAERNNELALSEAAARCTSCDFSLLKLSLIIERPVYFGNPIELAGKCPYSWGAGLIAQKLTRCVVDSEARKLSQATSCRVNPLLHLHMQTEDWTLDFFNYVVKPSQFLDSPSDPSSSPRAFSCRR